jgi:hypothetical protein
MDRIRMYKSRRMEAYFLGVLNKFIQSVEKHERTEKAHKNWEGTDDDVNPLVFVPDLSMRGVG